MTARNLHMFEDASILASCTTVYAVVYQPSIISKILLVDKSQISTKDVSIPRLDTVGVYLLKVNNRNTRTSC